MLHTSLSDSEPQNTDAKFDKYTKLFIITGVEETEKFEIRTRKEIQRIEWVNIDFLHRNLIDEDHNRKYSNVRPFIFLVTKYIAYLQGKVSPKSIKKSNEYDECYDAVQLNNNNTPLYFKKAKNLHFHEQDYEESYKFYQKAIESYDNAINALELLFSLALHYRNGVSECLELLQEYHVLFYNINDFKKHTTMLKSIEAALEKDMSKANKIVIEAVNDDYNIEYPMLKETSFRMQMNYSYVVEMVNQIFIEKESQDPTMFISNETMSDYISAYGSHSKPKTLNLFILILAYSFDELRLLQNDAFLYRRICIKILQKEL